MLSRSLLRTVARSTVSARTVSALPVAPRLAAAARASFSSSPASRGFFTKAADKAAAEETKPAAEAQAEAATPDAQAAEAKTAAKEEVTVEDPRIAELEAKLKESNDKITELTVSPSSCHLPIRSTLPAVRGRALVGDFLISSEPDASDPLIPYPRLSLIPLLQLRRSQTAIKYAQADYANLQRRSAEEFSQASEKGIKRFASDLLSTIDILSLALKHVPQPIPAENVALKALFDGVEMTQTELLKTLKRHGVEPINPLGEKFDPHFHEALFQVPVPGKEPGTVMDVSQVGYTLKGKSLRAAQVGVVRPSCLLARPCDVTTDS